MPSSSDHGNDLVEELADRLLARYGSSRTRASRPEHSWSNEVWIAETAVVRISRSVDGSLTREAALAAILPVDAGYPEVLGRGVTGELEWMVTKRLPGSNLEVAWPALDASTRAAAVSDLWTRLEAVHRTDVVAARTIGCTTTPFYALNETDAKYVLDWLFQNGAIDPALHVRLGDLLGQMFHAISGLPTVLCHTDAGPHNAVWDGSSAIPIDFEFAALAPADLDLENILRTLASHGEPNPASTLLEQATGLLARPGAKNRLYGYAVLRDLWALRGWLRQVRAGGSVEQWGAETRDLHTWAPWLHLHGHATRTSWLEELLTATGAGT
jgi:Phosphotransferase enzyme family